jgi:hypothetical protein
MEKGNGQESTGQGQAGQPPTDQPAAAPPGGVPQPPSTPAPTDTGGTAPVSSGGGGGGSQADQSGPQDEEETAQAGPPRREVLYQGYTEVPHPDGSVLRLDGNGGATFTDGSVALRLEGDQWVDAKSGQQSHRGHIAKADHRLRSLEMDRGLRKSMTP